MNTHPHKENTYTTHISRKAKLETLSKFCQISILSYTCSPAVTADDEQPTNRLSVEQLALLHQPHTHTHKHSRHDMRISRKLKHTLAHAPICQSVTQFAFRAFHVRRTFDILTKRKCHVTSCFAAHLQFPVEWAASEHADRLCATKVKYTMRK